MNHVEIKTDRMHLAALQEISQFYLLCHDPVGVSGLLTKELMWELLERMEAQLSNWNQKKFTLKLTGAQAMAFMAFWSPADLSSHPYEMVFIQRIIETIHKANLYANTFSGLRSGGTHPQANASGTGY